MQDTNAVSWKSLAVIGGSAVTIFVGAMLSSLSSDVASLKTQGERLAAVEAFQRLSEARLARIEDKLDRLLLASPK